LVGFLLRRIARKFFNPTEVHRPRRILILKPCCLGDVLLSTPLVAAIRQGYREAHITYAIGEWSRPMVATSKHIDAVLTIPDRWTTGSFLAVARELRQQRFDMVFVPGRSPLLGILTLLAGIPVRAGLNSRGRGFAYTHPVPVPQTVIHEADLYLLLAREMALPPVERRLWFFPTMADRQAAAALVAGLDGDGPLVILHPGGGSNPGMALERKRWLPERWAVVADTIRRERGARILVVGSAEEHGVVEAVRGHMAEPASAITRQWQWGVLAAVIERAALFLGHDTGMSLLANAVGTPHVVVFGPSDPQTYGPYGANGRAVWRPTEPSPCFYDGAAPLDCPCAHQCMRNVEPSNVLKLVDEVWGFHGR
jgi:ADP-heptose:LPS heptosyltransferase